MKNVLAKRFFASPKKSNASNSDAIVIYVNDLYFVSKT